MRAWNTTDVLPAIRNPGDHFNAWHLPFKIPSAKQPDSLLLILRRALQPCAPHDEHQDDGGCSTTTIRHPSGLSRPIASSKVPGHKLFKEKSPLDAPFMLSELDYGLGRLRRKSGAGPGGLSNQVLKNFPYLSRSLLLTRLNFWNTREVHDFWKMALLVPFLKTNFLNFL